MKAVILGNTKLNYSWFVKTYRQGLKRNGVETWDIDYKSTALANIKQILLQIKPDFVFTHLTFHQHINPIHSVLQMYRDVSQKTGTRFIHTCNDARREDRFMGDISDAFYASLVGTHDMVKNCEKAHKIRTYYVPYSSLCYDKMHDMVPTLLYRQPVFTGSPNAHRTGWQDNRAQFIEDLQKKMTIHIFKTQSAEDLRKKSHALSASAECILGLCVGYEIDGYIDVRPFQYLGSGACMIMRKYPNTEDIIPDDLYYPIHGYGKEDVNQVYYHWKTILESNTMPMREKAFNYIQQNHSCEVRIKQVLELLK
jgi:hypothetical protein